MTLPIFSKIFRDLGREKTFVFALLLQILLILSISIILGYTSLFFSPEVLLTEDVKIGSVDPGRLEGMLAEDRKAELYVYDNEEDALEDFVSGKLDTVVMGLEDGERKVFRLYLPESEIRSSIIMSLFKDKFETLEDEVRHETLETDAIMLSKIRYTDGRRKGADYIFELMYGYLIPFLFLVPIFLIGSLVIDTLSQEIEHKTMHILLLSASFKKIIYEVVLASVVLSILQVFLWMFLLSLRGLSVSGKLGVFFYVVVFSVMVSLFSIWLSVVLKSKTRSQLIYSIFVMVISVTSGVVYFNPVNVFSKYATGIASVDIVSYLVPIAVSGILILVLFRKRTIEDIA